MVSCEADISVIERTKEDDFIAICCDGVFDVNSNSELVDVITKRIPVKSNLKDLCDEIVDYSCHKVRDYFLNVALKYFLGFLRSTYFETAI